MKVLLFSFLLVIGLLIAFLATYTYTGWNLISSTEAKRRIAIGDIRTVVDVRTGIEWNRGHYPTAIHLPISEITQQKINDLKANRIVREPVLVYCNTGQRARYAADLMIQYGVSPVYYISGHWESLV